MKKRFEPRPIDKKKAFWDSFFCDCYGKAHSPEGKGKPCLLCEAMGQCWNKSNGNATYRIDTKKRRGEA